MKIMISLDECEDWGLSPNIVYRKLFTEYVEQLTKKHGTNFWGMAHGCDEIARQLYAQKMNRPSNVKNLILTYKDAENVLGLFKQFADVWVKGFLEEVK